MQWFYVLREGNQVANALTNYGLSLNRQIYFFYIVLNFISCVVIVYVSSIVFPGKF